MWLTSPRGTIETLRPLKMIVLCGHYLLHISEHCVHLKGHLMPPKQIINKFESITKMKSNFKEDFNQEI